MAWHDPITWNLGQIVSEDDLNDQIRDNMNYLFARPRSNFRNSTQYSTTSTSYTEISSALRLTVSTNGGDLLIGFNFVCYVEDPNSVHAHFTIEVDGVDVQSGNGGLAQWAAAAPGNISITFMKSVSAGSHTIKFMWKESNDGSYSDNTIYVGGTLGGWIAGGSANNSVWAMEM